MSHKAETSHSLKLRLRGGSDLMKISMMDRHTSTLTLSFWNMSRNGRKRSCGRQDEKASYFRPPGSVYIWKAAVGSPWRRGWRSRGSR